MGTAADTDPALTVVLPAFNEAGTLEACVARVRAWLQGHADTWEILIVDDGSADATGAIAARLAGADARIRILHHATNRGLGAALRSAFAASRGAIVVTLDVDLSYDPEHIGRMIERVRAHHAQLVLASPYMHGGTLTRVPWARRWLSVGANRFLRRFAPGRISTLTGMVRAYQGAFIRSLDLRSSGMDIMPEVIYKTMVLRGRIEEVPGHLDWTAQRSAGSARTSSMAVARHMFATIMAGFVFRPFVFFIVPGAVILVFALWVNFWSFAHLFEAYATPAAALHSGADRLTFAMARAYAAYPFTYLIGLLALTIALQLIGLGVLSLQSKRHFEELFHLGTSLRRDVRQHAGHGARPGEGDA